MTTHDVLDDRLALYMGVPGLMWQPDIHLLQPDHPVAASMRRELNDDRWTVFYHTGTDRYVLAMWLDGPRPGEDVPGLLYEQTSWLADGECPKSTGDMAVAFRQGRGYGERMRDLHREAVKRQRDEEYARYAEAREVGAHLVRKLNTQGYSGCYDERRMRKGLDLLPGINFAQREEIKEMGHRMLELLRTNPNTMRKRR